MFHKSIKQYSWAYTHSSLTGCQESQYFNLILLKKCMSQKLGNKHWNKHRKIIYMIENIDWIYDWKHRLKTVQNKAKGMYDSSDTCTWAEQIKVNNSSAISSILRLSSWQFKETIHLQPIFSLILFYLGGIHILIIITMIVIIIHTIIILKTLNKLLLIPHDNRHVHCLTCFKLLSNSKCSLKVSLENWQTFYSSYYNPDAINLM